MSDATTTRTEAAGEEFRVESRTGLPAGEVRALSKISALRSTWAIVKTVALAAA